jgi:hypothetical protein
MTMQQLLEALTDISRRGFLKGAAATAAACGLGGCGIVADVKEGKNRFLNLKRGMSKQQVQSIMGNDLANIGPTKEKSRIDNSSVWKYNGVGSVYFYDDVVARLDYVDADFNNYREKELEEDATSEDIARISYLAKHK